jgi:hypothetical protein
MTELRSRLSFANVMSAVAVFIALGGSAWAISANSVGTKQIKRSAVRSSDIKNGGAKAVDLATEPTHIIGQPGEPPFLNGWVNSDTTNFRPAGFFKDSFGVVHLQWMVEDGTAGAMFQLPDGYTSGKGQYFSASLPNDAAAGEIIVSFNGTVSRNGFIAPSDAISLEGISFRVP